MMRKYKEHGFVLLVTITVMMGMLAVVTGLVNNNKASKNSFETDLFDAQALYSESNAKSILKLRAQLAPPSEQSVLQKNWSYPGALDYPHVFKLTNSPGTAGTAFDVATLIPYFMAYASSRDSNMLEMTLTGAIASTGGASPSYSNGTDIIKANGSDFMIIENELVVVGGARGVAGVQSAHPVGAKVYGLLETFISNAVVRVGREWCQVTDLNFSSGRITVTRGAYGTDAANMGQSLVNLQAGDLIELYPFFPGLGYGKSVTTSGIQVRVRSENARINVSSLPRAATTALFNDGALFDACVSNNRFFFSLGEAIHAASNVTVIRSFKDSYTTYSSPSLASPSYLALMGGVFNAQRLKIDETSFAFSQSAAVSAGITDLVAPVHALNVNEASVETMGLAFDAMGLSNGIGLAESIHTYRTGGDGDFITGVSNPFDGAGYNNPAPFNKLSSAEEEFLYFIENNAGLAAVGVNDDKKIVMNHLLNERFALLDLGAAAMGPRISLTAGDVWRITTNISQGDSAQPLLSKRSVAVVKVNPIYKNVTSQTIVLNSKSGWNEDHSTFYGVTKYQPFLEDLGAPSPSDNVVNVAEFSTLGRGSAHLAPGMVGKSGSTEYKVMARLPSITPGAQMILDADCNGDVLDFGLRPLTVGPDASATTFVEYTDFLQYDFPAIAGNQHAFYNGSLPASALSSLADLNTQFYVYSGTELLYSARVIGSASGNIQFDVPPPAGLANVAQPGTNQVFLRQDFNSSYYRVASGAGSATSYVAGGADSGPIYETVLTREGGTFNRITWSDSSSLTVAGPTVKAYYSALGSNNWTALVNGGAVSVDDVIKLRFVFSNGSIADISPALYDVKAEYSMAENAPRQIIYQRE